MNVNVSKVYYNNIWLNCLFRVGEIKGELAQQIRADFEEAFQGPGAKVRMAKLLHDIC